MSMRNNHQYTGTCMKLKLKDLFGNPPLDRPQWQMINDKWLLSWHQTLPCWNCLRETNIIWKTDCQTPSKSLLRVVSKVLPVLPALSLSWRNAFLETDIVSKFGHKSPLDLLSEIPYNLSCHTKAHKHLDTYPTWIKHKGQSGKDGILKRCAEIIQTVNFSPCPGNKSSNPLSSASND